MVFIAKCSFMVFFLLGNIFLGFPKEHTVFYWKISLVLFSDLKFLTAISERAIGRNVKKLVEK